MNTKRRIIPTSEYIDQIAGTLVRVSGTVTSVGPFRPYAEVQTPEGKYIIDSWSMDKSTTEKFVEVIQEGREVLVHGILVRTGRGDTIIPAQPDHISYIT